MTRFFRLLEADDKGAALRLVARCSDARVYEVDPKSFGQIPGSPFAYWAGNAVRKAFSSYQALGKQALVTSGTGTLDDFRFLRSWWEPDQNAGYFPFAKGGTFSLIYYDQHLVVQWKNDGHEMKAWIIHRYSGGHWARNIRSTDHYFRPGLTWPRRTQSGLGLRAMPAGCIFADKGPAAFVGGDKPEDLLSLLAITISRPFRYLVELQMCFGSYEVGVIQRTPVPDLTQAQRTELAILAHRAWSLKRTLDTVNETSHAFVLPAPLLQRLMPDGFDPTAIEEEIAGVHRIIDDVAFRLYELDAGDRVLIESWSRKAAVSVPTIDVAQQMSDDEDTDEDDTGDIVADDAKALLSWAAGVAFGRFDIRLATGERQLPPEPEPFEPLPPRSPGMLPNGAIPFHAQPGILVDDPGRRHALPRLIEDVLAAVDYSATEDVRGGIYIRDKSA